MKILLASNNKGKINEIRDLCPDYEVLSLNDISILLGRSISITEEQNTFEENALEKCQGLYEQVKEYDPNVICIADDSGLMIDGLNGFPGVHTARWMDADDHIKNIELLNRMRENNNRECHYTTAIALVSAHLSKVYTNVLNGLLADACTGENGFGFDEIFMLESGFTLAEISTVEKYKISPRTKALELLKEELDKRKKFCF